jgi:hypothetical protein
MVDEELQFGLMAVPALHPVTNLRFLVRSIPARTSFAVVRAP